MSFGDKLSSIDLAITIWPSRNNPIDNRLCTHLICDGCITGHCKILIAFQVPSVRSQSYVKIYKLINIERWCHQRYLPIQWNHTRKAFNTRLFVQVFFYMRRSNPAAMYYVKWSLDHNDFILMWQWKKKLKPIVELNQNLYVSSSS